MAFWSNLQVEPKRQHRWFVRFGSNNLLSNLTYAAKKVSKPSMKIGSITHKYLNHFFNFPGRAEWNDVSITFASVREPDATVFLDLATMVGGYQLPRVQEERNTISKQKFSTALGSIDISQVDAEGIVIETWTLYNPFFTEVKYGELDYGNEEIVDIQCTIKYDWASLNNNRGTGQAVASSDEPAGE